MILASFNDTPSASGIHTPHTNTHMHTVNQMHTNSFPEEFLPAGVEQISFQSDNMVLQSVIRWLACG